LSKRSPDCCLAPSATPPEPSCETCAAASGPDFDCRAFRDALGRFATGVAVVTAQGPGGAPVGLTISSFNSVSLDPPLVLWSLALNSPNLEAFQSASHYAVNILALDQVDVSQNFAMRGGDKFGAQAWHAGLGGAPLLDGCCAWFECRNEIRHPGGDHLIFIGRVERFVQGEENSPLLFHAGRYRRLLED
jgi:flavin reductase (DIM6/NTAB) family NADH-FMN oxidoreductase RutF